MLSRLFLSLLLIASCALAQKQKPIDSRPVRLPDGMILANDARLAGGSEHLLELLTSYCRGCRTRMNGEPFPGPTGSGPFDYYLPGTNPVNGLPCLVVVRMENHLPGQCEAPESECKMKKKCAISTPHVLITVPPGDPTFLYEPWVNGAPNDDIAIGMAFQDDGSPTFLADLMAWPSNWIACFTGGPYMGAEGMGIYDVYTCDTSNIFELRVGEFVVASWTLACTKCEWEDEAMPLPMPL